MRKLLIPLGLCASLFFSGCEDDELAPRPKGYFRIDLPEKHYRAWDSGAPFAFEVPQYCRVLPDSEKRAEPFWFNLDYGSFKGIVHLSYKRIENNTKEHSIDAYLAQCREMAIQHQVKASGMKESPVLNDSAGVYGLIYEFGGNTASSVQFYLTDSTQHFVRGALYFWARPNSDSLAPSLKFITEDIYHMVETFHWTAVK